MASGEGRVGRRRWLVVVGLVAGLLIADLCRAPERQLTARVLLGGIDLYQGLASPWLARGGVRCRFEPSCSRYAEAVIRRHGAVVGTAKTGYRLLRCTPLTPAGTVDPP